MEVMNYAATGYGVGVETIEYAVKSCERTDKGRHRSFFLKRLEHHLKDRGIKVPDLIFDLFDTPFKDFTPQYCGVYETKIKGQALFHIFSDMLVEIYDLIEADRTGWEAAANYLEDTPMKVCALHALTRIQQLEEIEEEADYASLDLMEEFSGIAKSGVTPRDEKLNVRPYKGKGKGHRRRK